MKVTEGGFHARLLAKAPEGWRYVRLYADGRVRYFLNDPAEYPEPPGVPYAEDQVVPPPVLVLDTSTRSQTHFQSLSQAHTKSQSQKDDDVSVASEQTLPPPADINIVHVSVDAETLAEVRSYEDGRVLVLHQDGLREVFHPDDTRVATHRSGSSVYIQKDAPVAAPTGLSYPAVEIDLEIDSVSRDHSRGIKVPPLTRLEMRRVW